MRGLTALLRVELKKQEREAPPPGARTSVRRSKPPVLGASTQRTLGKLAGHMMVVGAVIAVVLLLWSLQGTSTRELASPSDTSSPGDPIPQPPPIAAPKVEQVNPQAGESHQASAPIDLSQFSPEVREDIQAIFRLPAEIEKIPVTGPLPSREQIAALYKLSWDWTSNPDTPENAEYRAWFWDPATKSAREMASARLRKDVFFEELNEILRDPSTSALGKSALKRLIESQQKRFAEAPEDSAAEFTDFRENWLRRPSVLPAPYAELLSFLGDREKYLREKRTRTHEDNEIPSNIVEMERDNVRAFIFQWAAAPAHVPTVKD